MDPENSSGTALMVDVDVTVDGSDERRIPADEYPVRLIKVEKKNSKKGDPMLIWDVAVVGGSYAGFAGRLYTVLTKQAEWKAKRTAKAFGCLVKDESTGKGKITVPLDAKGRVALGTIEDEEYDGEIVSRVKDVKPHVQGYDFDPNAEDDLLA